MGRPPRFRNEIEVAVAQRPWPETCIIFTGRRQPNGYGRVSENGTYVGCRQPPALRWRPVLAGGHPWLT